MKSSRAAFAAIILIAVYLSGSAFGQANQTKLIERPSTRVVNPDQHARSGSGSYPFRDKVDEIIEDLDLRPGDVVVDIGAGDGWWSERMAPCVGEKGVIHALEVAEKKVEQMKKKFADTPQIKPFLGPFDKTGLEDDSCDLALFVQVYHHVDADTRVDYLRSLRKTLKKTGRVVVIEKYSTIATRSVEHGTVLSELIKAAEEAGWVLAGYELMPGTYHYMATFVQKDLFPPEPEVKRNKGARNKAKGGKAKAPAKASE